MDTKIKLSDKLDNMIGNFAEGNMPDHAFLTALRECVTEAERLEASLPTLNIGIRESDVMPLAEATFETIYHHKPRLEGSDTLRVVNIADGIRAANAHTKAVTVEAIVKLAEEWDAYRVVTPTDPDGIEDFHARLLKLIQQP